MTRTLFASLGLLAFAPASALASTLALPSMCDPSTRLAADDEMCACYFKGSQAESEALREADFTGTYTAPTYDAWESGFTLGSGSASVTLPESTTPGSCYEIDTHVNVTGGSMASRNRVTKRLHTLGDRAASYWGHTFEFGTDDDDSDGRDDTVIYGPGDGGFIAFGNEGTGVFSADGNSGYTKPIGFGLSEVRDAQHNVIGTVQHGPNEIKGVVLEDFDGDGFLDVEFMLQDTRMLTGMGNGSVMQMFIIQ